MKRFFAVLGLLLSAPCAADETAIYRCTDAGGALTVQNMPCPPGSRQEKKMVQGVGSMPMGGAGPPAAAANAPAPPAPLPGFGAPTLDGEVARHEDRILDSARPAPREDMPSANDGPRLPPPVLFQCTTYDNDGYISEEQQQPPRCVPLRTIGLDGNPRGGAGAACEMKRDQCVRVPDGALCDAWKKRLGETEVAWRFGRPENAEKNRGEYERVQRIVGESVCGKAPGT